jgi:large subunit ribosomal protein L28
VQCLSQQLRSFSLSSRQFGHKQALANSHANLPDYPYGESHWYKQSNFGLYGGLKISSGNNVSPKTETKSRRKWRPNIQMKRLYSHALNRYVRVKVATRVLRTIDKTGGLDEYLTGEKPARIKELGMKGWALRCKVMNTPWWMERKIQHREEFGLSPIRKYIPEEKMDAGEREVLIGMFGERLQDAALAAEALAEDHQLNEAEQEFDENGNAKGLPDLIAYEEAEDGLTQEASTAAEEGAFKEIGKVVEEPEFEYRSAKLKRRAIVKEKKAEAARARAEYSAQKAAEKAQTDGLPIPQKSLRANDLRQHLAYQQEKDNMEAAGKLLSTSGSASSTAQARTPL